MTLAHHQLHRWLMLFSCTTRLPGGADGLRWRLSCSTSKREYAWIQGSSNVHLPSFASLSFAVSLRCAQPLRSGSRAPCTTPSTIETSLWWEHTPLVRGAASSHHASSSDCRFSSWFWPFLATEHLRQDPVQIHEGDRAQRQDGSMTGVRGKRRHSRLIQFINQKPY